MTLNTTNDVQEDIQNLINEINKYTTGDSISKVINIVAYGTLAVDIPAFVGSVAIGTFQHNLGYAPAFLTNLIQNDFFYTMPFTEGSYSYVNPPKKPGDYPFAQVDCYADTKNLYIRWVNTPNLPGVYGTGRAVFSYYLFSQPIKTS